MLLILCECPNYTALVHNRLLKLGLKYSNIGDSAILNKTVSNNYFNISTISNLKGIKIRPFYKLIVLVIKENTFEFYKKLFALEEYKETEVVVGDNLEEIVEGVISLMNQCKASINTSSSNTGNNINTSASININSSINGNTSITNTGSNFIWMEDYRIPFDKYFMLIAQTVSLRSNCIKSKVGCILVCDHLIISTGYNGTPFSFANCFKGGCLRCNSLSKDLQGCFCVHAEENCLLSSSSNLNCVLYTTRFPCKLCCKKIVQCRIKKVVYRTKYSDEDEVVRKIFEDVGIEVVQISL